MCSDEGQSRESEGSGERGQTFDWVGAWSERRARLSPEKAGLVDATSGQTFTYRELDTRANQTARLLRGYDVADGSRVATLSRNRPELVDCFFATGKTGGVLAPLSHRLALPELAAMLSTVDPELLVVEAPFVDFARDVLGHEDCSVDADIEVLVVDDSDNDAGRSDDWPRYHDELPDDDSPVDTADVSLSDPHLFLHTGGSTGIPKETVVTHQSIVWNSFNTITAWGLRPEDTTPMVFPMFHTGGWNVLTVPLFHVGGTVVVAREFDASGVLRSIAEHDASVFVGVPAVLRTMCRHDDWAETDLSSLRFVKSGGGPCRQSVMEAWWERGVDLSQGYGLTECGPNNFAMPEGWSRESHEKADSVGILAMHVDARVVGDDGPVPQGDVGELELAGLHAADGYWQAPEESAETFGDGWVSTGDLARVDDDGYYHIVGRTKNMYVSGGENVYPTEVEDAISAHPKVEEVVVIGVPDEQWGQVGKAVVEGNESLTLDELQAFLDGRLARFKLPKQLAFVDEIPTSGPSKLDREAIEAEFGES